MSTKLKILQVAIAKQDFVLAAHALVYGMIKARIQENKQNGKTRTTTGQPKRP